VIGKGLSLLPGKRKWAKSPAREEALRESI
jgi:hypothetical protein